MIERPTGGIARQESTSAPALFFVTFLFVFVSLTPFPDLSVRAESAGSAFNQLLALALLTGALLYLWGTHKLAMTLRSQLWMGLLFCWIAMAAFAGFDPFSSLRRLAMAGLVCVAAAAMLLYPKNEDQFARWLGAGVLIVLSLSYFGVAFLPKRAIHQPGDFLEPFLAGDWRGHFGHKNTAASVMALSIFVGLYLYARSARLFGAVVIILSTIFVWFSGGKTALGLIPLILILSVILERRPRLGAIAMFISLTVMGVGTLGVVFSPDLNARLATLGVETTFTGRTDIWALAIDYVRREPIWGYGYQMFWQRPELQYGFREVPTWATMTVDAHNGYLDIALAAGLPAVALMLIWLLAVPLRNIARMAPATRQTPLTQFYMRTWLFVLMLGFLETTFVTSAGPTWFLMLVAVFGIHLQAAAVLIETTPDRGKVKQGPEPSNDRYDGITRPGDAYTG